MQLGVSTNSGMDYWNGTLDWTTGMSFLNFLKVFIIIMCLFDCHSTYKLYILHAWQYLTSVWLTRLFGSDFSLSKHYSLSENIVDRYQYFVFNAINCLRPL